MVLAKINTAWWHFVPEWLFLIFLAVPAVVLFQLQRQNFLACKTDTAPAYTPARKFPTDIHGCRDNAYHGQMSYLFLYVRREARVALPVLEPP